MSNCAISSIHLACRRDKAFCVWKFSNVWWSVKTSNWLPSRSARHFFQGPYNCKQFLFMDRVVELGSLQLRRIVCDQPCSLPCWAPWQYSTSAVITGIHRHKDFVLPRIHMINNGKTVRGHHQSFYWVKGWLMFLSPVNNNRTLTPVRGVSTLVNSARFWRKEARYWTKPRNLRTSPAVLGIAQSSIRATFELSGSIPWTDILWPKNFSSYLKNSDLCALQYRHSSRRASIICFHMFLVLFQRLGPNDNVIQINVANFTNEIMESIIHMTLMNRRRVFHALRHDSPLIQTKRSGHSSQWDTVRVHFCMEETVGHVQLAPNLTITSIS